jgi:hypothetical protein
MQKKAKTKQYGTHDYSTVSENGKYGYINNNTGELLTPVKYDRVCGWVQNLKHFFEGRHLAKVKLNGKWGCINMDGVEIVPIKYDEIEIYQSDDPCVAVCIDGEWGFIDDETGTEIIPCEYDSVCSFQSHRARVEKDGKYGYIDDKGAIVIPIIYDDCDPHLHEPLCRVVINGKCGYINMKGKKVVKFRYEYAAPFHYFKDMAAVVFHGKVGFIDETGKEIIPCIYEPLKDPKDYDCWLYYRFYDGFANVKHNGKWGVIDKNNNVVIPFLYDAFLNDRNIGWRYAKRDGKILTIDSKGHERLAKKNPHARTFKDCLRTVTLEEVVEKGRSLFNLSDEEVEGLKTGFHKFLSRQPRPSKDFIRIYKVYDRIHARCCSVKDKCSYLFFPLEEVLDMEVRLEDDLILSDAEIVVHCIQRACDDLLMDQEIWKLYD